MSNPARNTRKKHESAIVAFSGGLDTSMLVPYLRDEYGIKNITTCFVDTGGMSEEDKQTIQKRAEELRADRHICVDATQAFFDEIIKYLIFGNVTRDGYPLCVGAERLIQARETIRTAIENGISLVANGCTGAGNDQYRFDLVANVLGEDIETIAPVRDQSITRAFSQNYLKDRQISVPDKARYSYNAGLWGVSIGGDETHTSQGLIPDEAWYSQPDPDLVEAEIQIEFDRGVPVRMSDTVRKIETDGPVDVIRQLAKTGQDLGIGRHYHVGTSIPGKKGRIAYESPAADILYESHRTLEKHVLSQAQIFMKMHVANEFGRLIHEAHFFDPLIDDLKAYLESSQSRVSGVCTLRLKPWRIESVTVDTPNDLLQVDGSVYGEEAEYYNARDALGASRLHSYEQVLIRKSERG